MKEDALELYARHLSLPELGVIGQEKLLATELVCENPQIARALKKMGVKVVREAALRVVDDNAVMTGDVDFDINVSIGPQDFMMAKHHDASAPLHMKERFFGSLVASEVVLWILGKRPKQYTLHVEYPTYKILP